MKKSMGLMAAVACGIFAGCATPGGVNGDASLLEGLINEIELGAYTGTVVAVQDDPEDLAEFREAAKRLRDLAGAESITVSDLTNVLGELPIEEFAGEDVRLVVGAANIVLKRYDREILDLREVEDLRRVVEALERGMGSALEILAGS